MGRRLRPLGEQTLVITGATSGIGLATARHAVERGARVVIAARDEAGLARAAEGLEAAGPGRVAYAMADVARREDLDGVAGLARRRFGGFDTWVNNAAVASYGDIEAVPLEDARRTFETNYWGVVNGCLAALPELRRRGGALITVGSVLSDRAVPLQGHYSASKHAVKGFVEALRMELERDGAPVAVTLVKPSGVDTPYPEHAADHMEVEPTLPGPVYTPDVVARAILACAERPRRDLYVGIAGPMLGGAGALLPRVMDRYMERVVDRQQRRGVPRQPGRREAVHAPARGDVRERGEHRGPVLRHSAYTAAVLHPARAGAALAAAGAAVALAARGRR